MASSFVQEAKNKVASKIKLSFFMVSDLELVLLLDAMINKWLRNLLKKTEIQELKNLASQYLRISLFLKFYQS